MLTSGTNTRMVFFALIALSFLLRFLPIVDRPFLWVETFFHELSHGLMAVLTGGKIVDIRISWNGSGLCQTLGGTRFLVAFAGYFGAQIAGALIYMAGSGKSIRFNQVFAAGMSVLVLFSLVFYAAGLTTKIIHAILLLLFALPLFKLSAKYLGIFIQFIGAFVITNSIISPIYQLGSLRSDAATLSQLTFLPAIAWVTIWCALGFAIFVLLFRSHKKWV